MGGLEIENLNKVDREILSVKDHDCSRVSRGESSRRWSQLVGRSDSVSRVF